VPTSPFKREKKKGDNRRPDTGRGVAILSDQKAVTIVQNDCSYPVPEAVLSSDLRHLNAAKSEHGTAACEPEMEALCNESAFLC
jgi:hypothetical protein